MLAFPAESPPESVLTSGRVLCASAPLRPAVAWAVTNRYRLLPTRHRANTAAKLPSHVVSAGARRDARTTGNGGGGKPAPSGLRCSSEGSSHGIRFCNPSACRERAFRRRAGAVEEPVTVSRPQRRDHSVVLVAETANVCAERRRTPSSSLFIMRFLAAHLSDRRRRPLLRWCGKGSEQVPGRGGGRWENCRSSRAAGLSAIRLRPMRTRAFAARACVTLTAEARRHETRRA
jgi:hypothetical protein